MSDTALLALKIGLLALLYVFVLWTMRTAWTGVAGRRGREPTRGTPATPGRRAPQPVSARAAVPAAAPAPFAASAKESRAPAKAKPPLVVVARDSDGHKLARIKLARPLSVGRAEGNEIRPDDTYVSQTHARLFPKDGAWFVEDLGSTNGTFVNEKRIASAVELHAGDRVRVGGTSLEMGR